jgi:TRAP-type C4-dicarboxylate transport system substrate-binding protein
MKSAWLRALALTAGLLAMPSEPGRAEETQRLSLRVVGGLADVNQFTRHERPFWTQRVVERSNGTITAEIAPFDQSGIRASEMTRLIKLGVVPFGTILLSLLSGDEPRAAAMEIAGLNPDLDSQRRSVEAFRPVLEKIIREQAGAELLAVYVYPAQVLFCTERMERLADLAGRRVRTSSVLQADFVEALGATPVITPFAAIVNSVRAKSVDCVITGTMSGNTIGLHEVTSQIYPMPLGWGLSAFVASTGTWNAMPEEHRRFLRRELAALEREIWDAAAAETAEGIVCNIGAPGCNTGKRGRMTMASITPEDDRQRIDLLRNVTLPRWLDRCGTDCAEEWNRTVGAALAINVDTP